MSTSSNATFEFVKQLGRELAQKDFDLPSFPDTALKVQEVLQDPDVSIDKLCAVVQTDPGLTARLLKMANSAMIRRGPIEVTDIKTAISRIGLDMVQNAAVSIAAREAFPAPAGSTLQDELDRTRRHSIKVSALAYLLARKVKFVGKADEAMLAGLLHAVGKFYIMMRAEQFPELFAEAAALEALLDQWHAGVGRAIVEAWGFPDHIAQAVDEHEVIDRDEFLSADITDLVLVANVLAKASDGVPLEIEELKKIPSLARMSISAEDLLKLVEDAEDDVLSMTQAMS